MARRAESTLSCTKRSGLPTALSPGKLTASALLQSSVFPPRCRVAGARARSVAPRSSSARPSDGLAAGEVQKSMSPLPMYFLHNLLQERQGDEGDIPRQPPQLFDEHRELRSKRAQCRPCVRPCTQLPRWSGAVTPGPHADRRECYKPRRNRRWLSRLSREVPGGGTPPASPHSPVPLAIRPRRKPSSSSKVLSRLHPPSSSFPNSRRLTDNLVLSRLGRFRCCALLQCVPNGGVVLFQEGWIGLRLFGEGRSVVSCDGGVGPGFDWARVSWGWALKSERLTSQVDSGCWSAGGRRKGENDVRSVA